MHGYIASALAAAWFSTFLVDQATAAVGRGDSMVVNSQNAPLMRGSSTLATLPRGHRFEVLRTQGPWLGARTTVNGETISGWIWQGHATTPQQFAARPQSVRRYSAVPGAATPYRGPNPYRSNTLPSDMRDYYTGGVRSGSPLIMGGTRYGTNYWRADRKIIGY